jgi:hypothetical protein
MLATLLQIKILKSASTDPCANVAFLLSSVHQLSSAPVPPSKKPARDYRNRATQASKTPMPFPRFFRLAAGIAWPWSARPRQLEASNPAQGALHFGTKHTRPESQHRQAFSPFLFFRPSGINVPMGGYPPTENGRRYKCKIQGLRSDASGIGSAGGLLCLAD